MAPVATFSLQLLGGLLGVVFSGFFLLWVLHWSSGWHRASKSGARLPKGSFGWPIIGESLAFARSPPDFVSSHVKRYGRVFKSSLLLQPTIFGTTPEFARFVLSNSNLFASGWPASVAEVVGPKSFAHKDGSQHMALKKILQKPLLPEGLRTKVDVLETIVVENLASWAKLGTVVASEATKKISMDSGVYLLLGLRDFGSTPEGRSALQNLANLNKALVSPPVNLTGTSFNKGLKAKVALREYFKTLLKTRKVEKNKSEGDLLGALSAAQDDPKQRAEVKDLDDETIADNLASFWFGTYDTTATTFTWILKFLIENPNVLLRIQDEQKDIFKGKDLTVEEPRLTWEDTKKMVYALKFFQEVQRTISLAPFTIKKATEDVEYNGYLIPKGWRVAPMTNFIHSDPSNYPDPKRFNPDRFDVTAKPFTYLPFSAGPHICPGMETAKLLSLIFIHHVTTTYTFESVEPDKGVEYISFPTPIGGYPINFRRRV